MTRHVELRRTPLADLLVVQRFPHRDERGTLDRLFDLSGFEELGIDLSVAQVNHASTTRRGAIRGMHVQKPPAADAKLITCLQGKVFDVVVDVRSGSETFLKWFGFILDEKEPVSLLVPEGFAHGFQALVDDCELLYVHGGRYLASAEAGLRHDDPAIGIEWPEPLTEVSERDASHPLVSQDWSGIGW
mgnify:CR=1 FL=1